MNPKIKRRAELYSTTETYRDLTQELTKFQKNFSENFINYYHVLALKEFRKNLLCENLLESHQEIEEISSVIQSDGLIQQEVANVYALAIVKSIDDACSELSKQETINKLPENSQEQYRQQLDSLKTKLRNALILESQKHFKNFALNEANVWIDKPINMQLQIYKYLNFSLMFCATTIGIMGAFEVFPVLILGIILLAASMLFHHILMDHIEKNNKEQFEMKVMYNLSK